ncbi:MAG: hypothetical protein SGILL_000602 [Bacillariaceae sp.]
MPHLQASTAETKAAPSHEIRGMEGANSNENGANGSPASTGGDHLHIQEASKGYLGTSDPVVAMANKAEQCEKVSFDDSVEGGSKVAESPVGASKTVKSLVTPSPNGTQSRLPPGTATTTGSLDAKATSTTANAPGSPISSSSTSSSTSSEAGGPILTIYGKARLYHSPIRVKRRVSHSEDDVADDQAVLSTGKNLPETSYLRYGGESPTEPSGTTASRPALIRRGSSSIGKRKESTEDQEQNDVKRTKTEKASSQKESAVAAAAHEAAVEAASAMAGMRKKPVVSPASSGERVEGQHQPGSTAYDYQQRFQSPYYRNGAPYRYATHPGASYGYGYHGGSYGGYARPYYPPHPGAPASSSYQGYGQPAPTSYGGPIRTHGSPEAAGQIASSKVDPKRSMNNPQGDKAKDAVLPDFHRIVNYPDFLTKARNDGNCPSGRKNCVMCGKLRICSASSMASKGRSAAMVKAHHMGQGEDTSHIIPRQNKGLCTACDVTVWMVVEDGLEIKWCKGCKNFRPWAAFGSKGSATKCVRCRDRQREKYAMQRDELRSRKSRRDSNGSPTDSESSSGNEKERKPKPDVEAAQGLHSLLSAAATAM